MSLTGQSDGLLRQDFEALGLFKGDPSLKRVYFICDGSVLRPPFGPQFTHSKAEPALLNQTLRQIAEEVGDVSEKRVELVMAVPHTRTFYSSACQVLKEFVWGLKSFSPSIRTSDLLERLVPDPGFCHIDPDWMTGGDIESAFVQSEQSPFESPQVVGTSASVKSRYFRFVSELVGNFLKGELSDVTIAYVPFEVISQINLRRLFGEDKPIQPGEMYSITMSAIPGNMAVSSKVYFRGQWCPIHLQPMESLFAAQFVNISRMAFAAPDPASVRANS